MKNLTTKQCVTSSALLLVLSAMGSAQAACTSGNCFTFKNGAGGSSAANVSWFSMLASDTDSDGVADTNIYTSMRGTDTSLTTGTFDFGVINTITNGAAGAHNSGNMIDRDWSFFSNWGAHYTDRALQVTCDGNFGAPGNYCVIKMVGWTVAWNGEVINMGGGLTGTITDDYAVMNNNNGTWGDGDDTIDYAAVVPTGGFAGVNYGFHFYGSFDMVAAKASGLLLWGAPDTDSDGVVDPVDDAPGDNKIATPPSSLGTGKISVTITSGALTLVKAWSSTNSAFSDQPASVTFTDGLVDYTITGLANGATATVVIAFPTSIPTNAVLYKVNAAGNTWTLVNASTYTIAADRKTVTLTITDGGTGDADGVANGSIHDPIGWAAVIDNSASPLRASGPAGGGCSIQPEARFDLSLLLAALAGLGYAGWRRRNVH